MVWKRGAGLVGYVVECLDFVCTIYYHHRHCSCSCVLEVKITPDKNLNYEKKNLQFNIYQQYRLELQILCQ
jgi:hypothetical protein